MKSSAAVKPACHHIGASHSRFYTLDSAHLSYYDRYRIIRVRALAGIIFLLPLWLGASSPGETSRDVDAEACPFAFDPNLVEGKLLGWIVVEVGRSIKQTRTWSDPDGDDAMVEIVKGPRNALLVNHPKTSSYTIRWTPQRPQTTSIILRVTDNPSSGVPQSVTGTLLVQVTEPHRDMPPRLCGGAPR